MIPPPRITSRLLAQLNTVIIVPAVAAGSVQEVLPEPATIAADYLLILKQ